MVIFSTLLRAHPLWPSTSEIGVHSVRAFCTANRFRYFPQKSIGSVCVTSGGVKLISSLRPHVALAVPSLVRAYTASLFPSTAPTIPPIIKKRPRKIFRKLLISGALLLLLGNLSIIGFGLYLVKNYPLHCEILTDSDSARRAIKRANKRAVNEPLVVFSVKFTPLMWAICFDNYSPRLDVIEALLVRGADPNRPSTFRYGSTLQPLSLALVQNNIQAVEVLLQYGADPTLSFPFEGVKGSRSSNPFQTAILFNRTKSVELLLRSGRVSPDAQLEALVEYMSSPSVTAQVLEALVQHDRSLLERSHNIFRSGIMFTPLHAAAFRGRADIIRMLVAHGAVVDQPNAEGQTPLYWAHQSGHTQCVQTLLELGAAPLGDQT